MRLSIALVLLAACNIPPSGTKDSTHTGDDTSTVTGDGFCGVRQIFDRRCVSCHSPTLTQGDLDLATDPHAALVGVASPDYGVVRVVPGDPASSFLYQKVTGAQGANGDSMPPSTVLSAAEATLVSDWITAGATAACDTTDTSTHPGFHPPGYDAASAHGMDAKYQVLTCVDCHGDDLEGGASTVSCDGCHEAGWRTDCVFCHGGTDDTSGAPPRDIDNSDSSLSFPEHRAHLVGTTHPEWDCVQCHARPTDVLYAGHLFLGDTTPGIAEVAFGAGLSSSGTYGSSCSNLYCHGNGQRGDVGSVTSGESVSCHLCHGDSSSSRSLSGEHGEHLGEGVSCGDCHSTTASGNSTISHPDNHVDGDVDVSLPSGISYSSGSCNGSCHGESHNNRHWD